MLVAPVRPKYTCSRVRIKKSKISGTVPVVSLLVLILVESIGLGIVEVSATDHRATGPDFTCLRIDKKMVIAREAVETSDSNLHPIDGTTEADSLSTGAISSSFEQFLVVDATQGKRLGRAVGGLDPGSWAKSGHQGCDFVMTRRGSGTDDTS